MKVNAMKNYHAAWQLFRQVHRAVILFVYKKQIESKCQTSNHYAENKGTPTMVNVVNIAG